MFNHNARKLYHSSIRITGEKTVYVDPWQIEGEPHDADLILVTHDHHDHYSPEDIAKISKPNTVLVTPAYMATDNALSVVPGKHYIICGMPVETVASYNIGRPFHTPDRNNVGYLLENGGIRYFIAGDTDRIPENRTVRCDVALVPAGGKYTMDAAEAALLVNDIHPKVAIPTHYGTVTDSADAPAVFAAGVDKDILVEIQ